MNTIKTIFAETPRPEMSPELSWAIIVLLAGVVVWVTIRYVNRLDKVLERLELHMSSMGKILTIHEELHKNHTKDIEELQGKVNIRPKRRN